MMFLAILTVPLGTCILFASALIAIWRGRQPASHAACWGLAFALIAVGWLALIATSLVLGAPLLPGAAPSLCWLAAALALVHGLRERAGQPSRSGALGAIWVAIAVAVGLLGDLMPVIAAVMQPTIALLACIGLVLAAVAVGPRPRTRDRRIAWSAVALLSGFAVANFGLVWLLLTGGEVTRGLVAVIALGASVAYVGLGLGAVLLLNRDLCVALERLARTDPLTGVWNRRGFDEAAPHLLTRLRMESGHRAAVAIADIDSFKGINDRHGHTTGDAVLVGFAKLLRGAVMPGDLLARLGGEEFALLAIGVDADELFARVEHVRSLVSLPADDRAGLPQITASFGVAQVHPTTLSLRDALERADHALYRAKHEGRNRSIIGELPQMAAE